VEAAERLRGSLIAGACGDALGAPLEFLTGAEIRARFGPQGPAEFVRGPYPLGAVTDDTQMTLFTAEGMIRARTRACLHGLCHPPGVVRHAYLRWLHCQGEPVHDRVREGVEHWPDGWLVEQPFLHHARSPGTTCLSALRDPREGTPQEPLNHSKGCGAVMRMAPAAVLDLFREDAFRSGCEFGALTHGHPTGYLAAGFLAATLARLLAGERLSQALDAATVRLRACPRHEETLAAVEMARRAAAAPGPPSADRVTSLGAGWVAEEALAIGVYCALVAPDVLTGLRLAVTHGGDSDSTGSIAGNLLGAIHGPDAVPATLRERVEGRDVIERVAADLAAHFLEQRPGIEEADGDRYPGW
jgi:ADP-ribosyl-[dinitrogen reductase] hydrolase